MTSNPELMRPRVDVPNEHVDTIMTFHTDAEKNLDTHQRIIEKATAQVGRPRTIYLLLTLVVVWTVGNLIVLTWGGEPWDPPPLHWLQGALALYAAVTGTMVLTTQIRQQRNADHRANLELQVSLTAEQKTAKVIGLIEELRRDMPNVRNRFDKEAEGMTHAVDSKAIMSALVETLEPETVRVAAENSV